MVLFTTETLLSKAVGIDRQLNSFFAGLQKQKAVSGGVGLSVWGEALWPQTEGVGGRCRSEGRSDPCILSVELMRPFFCLFLSHFSQWTWAVTRATSYLF